MSDIIAIPFKKNASFSIFGATSSGKSYFVFKFLKYIDQLYITEDKPQKIVFCYSVYQSLYDRIKLEIPAVEFYQGLPDSEKLTDFETNHTLLILDDLGELLVNDLNSALLFTQGCHHRGFSVMRISQNIFEKGKFSRTISINSSYLVLMKSPRDINQIRVLGSQIFGQNRERLIEAYENSNSINFGYLLIDLLPFSDNNLRLRSKIFPPDDMVVYAPLDFNPEDQNEFLI